MHSRAGDVGDVRDVRRELDDDRNRGDFLHPFDDLAGVIRNLADRAAHAALAHAVRAAEVELDAVGAATLRLLHHLMPRLAFRLHHQRRDDRMFRIIALDFRDLFEVVGNRPVADELDVVEAHHARGAEVDGAIAREHVDDGLADGFPDRATPAFIEGLGNLPVGVGWRARGKPERVRAADAREGGSKISHHDAPF